MALLTHTLLNRSAQLMGTEKTGRDVRELETCPAKGKKKKFSSYFTTKIGLSHLKPSQDNGTVSGGIGGGVQHSAFVPARPMQCHQSLPLSVAWLPQQGKVLTSLLIIVRQNPE